MLEDADRLEQPQRAERVGIGRVFRRLEAHLHVALRREIVDLGRLDLAQQPEQVGRIRHVAVVQEQPHAGIVAVAVEVIDALGIERATNGA